MGIFFFTAVSNGVQIACGSKYRHAIRRVSIIQTSLFYFSLLISYSLNGDLYQNGKNLIFFARKFRQQLESKGEVVTFTSWHGAFHCLAHLWRITSHDLDQTVFKMAAD